MLMWLVILPILVALFLYIFPFEKTGKIIALIAQVIYTGSTFYVFLATKNGEIITKVGNYEGVLGVVLKVDSLSSIFILLASFIFLVATIYDFNENFSRLFQFLMFIWQALLVGIFLSNDIFNIFILIEIATVVVAVLIMFNRNTRSMHDGMVYMMVNTVSIQFYLFGVGYIYKLTGTLDMDAVIQSLKLLDNTSLILPYALIMTSVSLKCALMPLFSWLPKAHSTPGAPSAVSAVLSGLHIKSGVYLFIRCQAIFQEIDLSIFFLYAGIITGIVGFVFALSQSDIKLTLAYSTVSQIGMIMIGLNSSDFYSYTGGVYHIINHALFKSSLFLCAGVIVHVYKTREISEIRGVLKRMPMTGITIIMSILGIVGAPFFNGNISKYFIMSGANLLVSSAITLINLGTIITFTKYASILFGDLKPEQCIVKIDIYKQAAMFIPGVLCLFGGIFGVQAVKFFFGVELSVNNVEYLQKIALFFISVAAGYLIYKYYVKSSALLKHIHAIELSFRGICVSIGVFFATILIITGLIVV